MKPCSKILSTFACFNSMRPEDLLPVHYRIGYGILPVGMAELRSINIIFPGPCTYYKYGF